MAAVAPQVGVAVPEDPFAENKTWLRRFCSLWSW